ncbi:glycoside hydrolase family 2 TIM barrel-domain containing protein [Pseudovibrio sp. Tun.PSC04-5.I4]|uniref:glycoside hydrolase family 2 protein n=1 Tax=Pseudovibrio sp. Tun.PSC04-5.I4 TaxID=1798213 RepID=UPI00088C6327|nr:glycoside hydrolase family 2 TIM barrel-domain containing protein [Pseudovibrio sp. Tun.PSC04-5.I4]SDQ72422.1 beta-glucuronidase [Pseudovibrio sp. Tun.PSC04-5.I4]
MLERMEGADNGLACLHDEDYDVPFNKQNLNSDTLIFTSGRTAESLNGDWNFCVDLLDTGLRQKWFSLKPETPEGRTEPYDYDPYLGETVPVPSCWSMLKEKWYFFEGSAWYTRPVDLDELPADERLFLRVGAAQYDCKVFLNGEFLGNHYGGSTPFNVELTGHAKTGRNWLMLCVNNTRTLDRVPMRNTDWFNYGGVYRSVELYRTPKTFISDFFAYLVPDGSYEKIAVELQVDGPITTSVCVEIEELEIKAQVIVDDEGKGKVIISAKPELWSPENPKLYNARASLGDDQISDRIGFRQIEQIGTDVLLNGKPIFMRGISVHEDDEFTGKVLLDEDLAQRFKHAKELNCNFMRFAHYPHDERAAKMADEQGVLLWEEIPVYWAIDFKNPATLKDASNQLRELIKRDRNRASVIIWSVGNENPDTDERLSFMKSLIDTAHEMDPTRLTSAACLVNHAKNRIEDRLIQYINIVGINEYYGWYEENFEDLIDFLDNSDPGKPVVISETGADGYIGDGKIEKGFFSEDYMAEVYQKQIATLRQREFVKGISPWILYDFRVERRQNIFQQGWNRKGLIASDKKTKKTAFKLLSDFYAELKANN